MSTYLDLDHLRTLVAIADCGGFGKASTALHMSQPALSQHVRLLERGLKRKLFQREGRGMRLTPEGHRVLAEARTLLAAHDRAMERLAIHSPREIVLGSSEHAAEQVLPEMIRAVHEAFPDATTRFEIGRSTHLSEAVDKGTVDLAFILASRGDEGGREITRLPLTWFAKPGWSPPSRDDVFPLVAFAEPCALRERAMAALAAAGHRVQVAGQATTLDGVLAGVRAGLGVALLPTIRKAPHGLVARDDLPPVGTASLNLLVRRGLDPAIEWAALAAGQAYFDQVAGSGVLKLLVEASDRSAMVIDRHDVSVLDRPRLGA